MERCDVHVSSSERLEPGRAREDELTTVLPVASARLGSYHAIDNRLVDPERPAAQPLVLAHTTHSERSCHLARYSGKGHIVAQQRYTFTSTYGTRHVDGGVSSKGKVVIHDKNASAPIILFLTARELRQAIRQFARALAYTKIARRKGQHDSTWDLAVDRRVEPIMKLVNAELPVKTK